MQAAGGASKGVWGKKVGKFGAGAAGGETTAGRQRPVPGNAKSAKCPFSVMQQQC